MTRQAPPKEAAKIAQTLQQLGFGIQLLGSTNYLHNRLENLNDQDLTTIKNIFIENRHPRFMKQFSTELPFGSKKAYSQAVTVASMEKVANLIRICGFLLQTKVYLFWTQNPLLVRFRTAINS